MQTRIRLLPTLMVPLLLLLNGCATTIHDNTHCALIPSYSNGQIHPAGGGATCDNVLTPNQKTLSEADWQALMLSWENSGNAVECTTSGAIGDLKAEIEELCSKAPNGCNEPTARKIIAAVNKVIAHVEKNIQFAQLQILNLLQ